MRRVGGFERVRTILTPFSRVSDAQHLEQADGLAHGRLDVQRLDVLPVLLEERDEEVDGCVDM